MTKNSGTSPGCAAPVIQGWLLPIKGPAFIFLVLHIGDQLIKAAVILIDIDAKLGKTGDEIRLPRLIGNDIFARITHSFRGICS